jgi:gas vesicle protein
MKYTLSFLIGTLVGGVIGAVTALLFAPSSGEELRENIKTQADTQYVKLQGEWEKGKQEMQTRIDKMSNDLQALSNRSKEIDEKAV